MRAYYYDNIPGDQRLPHDCIPSRPVSLEAVKALNIKFWTIPFEGYESEMNAISKERGCRNMDVIDVSKESLGDTYEELIKSYFREHMHGDEEIRYVISGSGFFDVREGPSDNWIRVAIEPGDFIILPPGMYHRFTLDEANFIKSVRMYQDKPNWIPYPRGQDTDVSPLRIQYLKSIGVGA